MSDTDEIISIEIMNDNNNIINDIFLGLFTNQGNRFNDLKEKLTNNLENFMEGYTNLFDSSNNLKLSEQNQKILEDTKYTSVSKLNSLRSQYSSTLEEYKKILSELTNDTILYLERTNPSNPYLGKNIRFSTGNVCYVTKQGVVKGYPSSPLFKGTSGKNGCPTSYININIPWKQTYNTPGTIIETNPRLISGTPMKLGQSCGNEGNNILVSSMVSNPKSSYIGCYNDKIDSSAMTFFANNKTTKECQTYAVDNGYKYFGLQGSNASGKSSCYVSNDLNTIKKYGESFKYTPISLWSSNTINTGKIAEFSKIGTLNVLNSSGISIFTTPNISSPNYIGCYKDDAKKRAMNVLLGDNMTYEECYNKAKLGKYKYFGLQNNGQEKNQCWATNSLKNATKYGISGTCTIKDKYTVGGAFTNAVYGTDPTDNYFLYLNDNGNLEIYRGSNPTDNQGIIWQTNTTGKSKEANPLFNASNSVFKQPWINVGTKIQVGQFVGSTNGSIYLMMEKNGNLVLYTSTKESSCQNERGSKLSNAVFEMNAVGSLNSLNKLGYIDENSNLFNYKSNDVGLSNEYTLYSNYNSNGNDITNGAFASTNVNECKTKCNSNAKCGGFIFDKTNNTCYLKNTNTYPKSSREPKINNDLYVRKSVIKKLPQGVSQNINQIDSIQYTNYIPYGTVQNSYGLASLSKEKKNRLEKLKTKLNNITKQIVEITGDFSKNTNKINTQNRINNTGINNYVKNLKNTNSKIFNFDWNQNYENILNDSEIRVLEENYKYIMWSILATGVLLLTLKFVKKE
jgi:ElaB/YqjD/DUF883 family membrane-anchored ribosome-binding protein